MAKDRRKLIAKILLVVVVCAVALAVFLVSASRVHAAVIQRAPNNLGLVGYWSFDEGVGTVAGDFSGNGNEGTFTGDPQWVSGRSGQALEFDGASRVSITSFDISTTETVSAWIYPTENQSAKVIGKHSGASNVQGTIGLNNGKASFEINAGGSYYNLTDTSELPLNAWSLITGVYDGSSAYLYVNGTEEVENSAASGEIANNSLDWSIGSLHGGSSSGSFTGIIDEARIYNRALSATEVQSLYDNTKSAVVGVTSTDRYTAGLVGHWTFDGSTVTATTVEDIAGSNDGTLSTTTGVRGVIGQGRRFGGFGTDGVDLGSSNDLTPSRFTVASWIKPEASGYQYHHIYSNARDCCGDYDGIDFNVNSNERINGRIWSNGTLTTITSDSSISANEWSHVIFSYDGSNMRLYINGELDKEAAHTDDPTTPASYNTYIGSMGHQNGSNFTVDGLLDDVRIYNRALSADEISGLYDVTRPHTVNASRSDRLTDGLVGLWTFDGADVTSTTVSDMSSNSNDGTINGDAGPAYGHIGQAFEFDGAGDYIDLGSHSSLYSTPNNKWTMSAWINPNTLSGNDVVVRRDSSGDGYYLRLNSGTLQSLLHWSSGTFVERSGGTVSSDEWSHVVLTYDGNTRKHYVNAAETGSWAENKTLSFTSDSSDITAIGRNSSASSEYFDGSIDDVRIYDRALSAREIQRLYDMGK